MSLRKPISIEDPQSWVAYDVRVQQQIAEQNQQSAGMFGDNNKLLLIGGLAVAAYLLFAPKPTKTKKVGSGLNAPKRKKRKPSKKGK